MRSFLIILKQTSKTIWQTASASSLLPETLPSSSYPSIVFDAVKDNPAFLRLIESQRSGQTPLTSMWPLAWFTSFLKSIPLGSPSDDKQATFSDVIAKMAAFTLDELQHTRFKEISVYAVQTMMGVSVPCSQNFIPLNPLR